MSTVNRAIIVGFLGRDAELRRTDGGAVVAMLSVATTEAWTGRDGVRQERTEWHRVVLWGKMAESLQEYLVKGKQVYVEGKIQTREWVNRDDAKRQTTEIRADRIVLLGGARSGGPRERDGREADRLPASSGPAPPIAAEPSDDDIPF